MNRENLDQDTNWHNPKAFDKAQATLWNIKGKKPQACSFSASAVETILLFWWGVNPEGRAHVSYQTIKDDTGIKSTVTLRKALKSLEASGRWIIVRSKGGEDIHSYYPQFIDNPVSQETRESHNPSRNHNPL